MAKKGTGTWKPFKMPSESVLIGDPLKSGQMPEDPEVRKREKAEVPAVSKTNPGIEEIGGGKSKK